ncbi:transglycosylase SLT domain-containing protein [Beggiatoa leptomitoformis]|uniref:Transglycosylase SLT domain-containing protein n=1 Tax=Beggiatoa leptomitoformis TaxID=288004 RepID=A0A2N9YDB3_9GAMM|nr:transglycosylase SLT domain-containing protein [Beggiatoa leptomitoformis]ALG69131.1 transglycosylase SLT domain-containing protein [Beggiatoa leptomitoformis]AUI68454.1 transglycosylase SLT domain-containing protein [Beggiatoa leptomitoformis]
MKQWMKSYGFILISMISLNQAIAANLTEQRLQFQTIYEAIQAKDDARYQTLLKNLQDYPITQYLEYLWLSDHLNNHTDIQNFLTHYADSPIAPRLRRAWLNQLIKENDWQRFIQAYTPQNNILLQCQYLSAVLRQQGKLSTTLITEAQNLWVVGKSQPSVCDPIFKYLNEQKQLSTALRWQRIRNAAAAGNLKLAISVAKTLDKEAQRWVNYWAKMHETPNDTLASVDYPDTPIVREIIVHGIKQLARTNAEAAYQHWQTLQTQYQFTPDDRDTVIYTLALRASWQESSQAINYLLQVDKSSIDEVLRQVALQTSLALQDWASLLKLAPLYATTDGKDWQYWQARALEQQGETAQAKAIYQILAQEREYYGFLSADRLQQPYQFNDEALNVTANDLATLQKNNNILNARELYYVGMEEFARLEWRIAIDNLSTEQLKVATALANEWNWYYETIVTAAKAKAFNALTLRFPTPYYDVVTRYAAEQNLNPAWVYAIIRQESAFNQQARSSANALGLMQLLPATAQEQAKRLGVTLNNQADIYQPELNVQLGTGYLQHLLNKLDNNLILVTASYNAGLSRARKWTEKYGCLPPDIWIELIPFKETRSYVENIMSYTPIFEWRLLGNDKLSPMPLQAINKIGGC